MAYETIVAAYDNTAHADAAVRALRAGGFANADISVFDRDRMGPTESVATAGLQRAGLWNRLFGRDVYKHEATIYDQAIEQGGAVVSARVLDREVAQAVAILNLHRPIDVHDRAVTSGLAQAPHVEAIENKIADLPVAAAQRVAVSAKVAAANEGVLRLAEEQLQVGKQMIEDGRTRVRRYVTERDVSADVTLHEEHAEVLRRAINEPASLKDIDWADKEIEVVETAEHALVNKTARVVEEVSLKKVGTEHVETVHEKLRRQQVEIERLDASGKPKGK
jgi:uncharacterized protein (TIGR02271 family)